MISVTQKTITSKNLRRYHEVRLVGMTNKEDNGVMLATNAFRLAQENELDLLVVNDLDIPICKIVDTKKLEYARKKKERAAKAATKTKVKEFRISTGSSDNDLQTACNKTLKALNKYGKTKLTIKLPRGRGKYINPKAPQEVLLKFMDMLNVEVEGNEEVIVEGRVAKKSHAHTAIIKKTIKKKKA